MLIHYLECIVIVTGELLKKRWDTELLAPLEMSGKWHSSD